MVFLSLLMILTVLGRRFLIFLTFSTRWCNGNKLVLLNCGCAGFFDRSGNCALKTRAAASTADSILTERCDAAVTWHLPKGSRAHLGLSEHDDAGGGPPVRCTSGCVTVLCIAARASQVVPCSTRPRGRHISWTTWRRWLLLIKEVAQAAGLVYAGTHAHTQFFTALADAGRKLDLQWSLARRTREEASPDDGATAGPAETPAESPGAAAPRGRPGRGKALLIRLIKTSPRHLADCHRSNSRIASSYPTATAIWAVGKFTNNFTRW